LLEEESFDKLSNEIMPWFEKNEINFITWQSYFDQIYINEPFSIYNSNYNTVKTNSFYFLLLNSNLKKKINDDQFDIENLDFENDFYLTKKSEDVETIYNFFFLRKSSFIKFFIDNLIDTPTCFKKIKSIKRRNLELPVLKLINFLMKNGKKEQYSKSFFKALMPYFLKNTQKLNSKNKNSIFFYKNNTFFLNNTNLNFIKSLNYDWLHIFLLLNNVITFGKNEVITEIFPTEEFSFNLNYNNTLSNEGKHVNSDNSIKHFLFLKLLAISPVFSFFIKNIDKSVKKFSRGKSGKYKLTWKYVAIYKRLLVALRFFIKDVKFSYGLKFINRLQSSIFNLIFKPKNNFLWKSKIFSHNFVFKNFKKSLMTSLKTIK